MNWKTLFLLPLLVLGTALGAQEERKKVTVQHADVIKRTVSVVEDAKRLLGNVAFLYEGSTLYCDSAYFYDNKDFEAWSRIVVNQGDSLLLYGDYLFLDYEDGIADIKDNVELVDKDITLSTDNMSYDLEKQIGSYYDGGTITSKADNNVLKSQEGYYLAEEKRFFFKKEVSLKNPEYSLLSDTLQYDTETDIAYFFGPTTINGESTDIYCENGWYNTQTDICQFNENALIISADKVLKGDSIYYDGQQKFGEVLGSVLVSDTAGQFFIEGDYAFHNEIGEESLVTGRALLTQVSDGDSLFLHADSLIATKDSSDFDVLLGFRDVRIFRSDLQGLCDSLSFTERDSTLALYKDPVLWSETNQISGDTIFLLSGEESIDRMIIPRNGIIVNEAAPDRYNQIQALRIEGYFEDNALRKILALGNGEAIYYPVEEEDSTITIMGMSRTLCSDIEIRLDSSEIQQIIFLERPSGRLLIPEDIKDEERKLSYFKWLVAERPKSKNDLFTPKPQPQAIISEEETPTE